MRIEDSTGKPISDLEQWAALYDTDTKRRHWKEHRSAYSVAKFTLERDGMRYLEQRVGSLIGESLTVERAIPEYEQRFDEFGHGREHDLGIFGSTSKGQSVFIGFEAKVDEAFGAPVKKAYLTAKARQIAGERTNAPERIERLLALNFANPSPSMFDVRYQLLYATAGTLAAGADISVLYVMVYKTPLYDSKIGDSNQRDYMNFIDLVKGKPLEISGEARAHELILDGKRLICIYETLEL